MLERVRSWWRAVARREKRRGFVSRREREERQRRLLIIVTAALALIVVVTLAAGAIWQYFLVPRETYATVNGVDIRRADYEKFRKYELLQELTSLNRQFQSASADQQPQIEQQILLLQAELGDLDNGDKNINPDALKEMVENQLVLQGLDDLGLAVTDREVDEFIDQLLAPVALTEPTATFTLPPTAAAWATETTEAFAEQSTATSEFLATQAEQTATAEANITPEDPNATASPEGTAEGTPSAAPEATVDATPTASPDLQATTEALATQTFAAPTGTPDPDATPDPNATATFTPVPTLEPTATPNSEQALATSRAGFELLDDNFLDRAGMSRGDFERLIAKPALARTKIRNALIADIPTSQDQVRASHILVATRAAALELMDGRLQTEDFAVVAEEVSTDTQSAAQGGDLGWFPRGVMTTPFEEAAFSQPVGELPAEPVQSEFGWHIILVVEREEDRPLTASMISGVQSSALNQWLDQQAESADISSTVTLPADDEPQPGLVGP